jgi:hypothetical protein
VNRIALLVPLAFLAGTSTLLCQSPGVAYHVVTVVSGVDGGASQEAPAIPPEQTTQASQAPLSAKPAKKADAPLKPFSRLAVGGGVSAMGINMQVATNLNRHLNLRGMGNYFNYTVNNISTNGFNVSGKVNFATGGAALDYYPFPRHGFRLSPGVLFYNQNQITANGVGATGSSITLSGTKYYSETANPLTLNGNLGLNTRKQAATLTTGWGNMIPRNGGHWSFPFEFGAAFTGVPGINVALTGSACTNQTDAATSGPSCVNMATNTTAQANLTAQINKWKSDLNALQVYPIISFGVAYSFPLW